MKHQAGARSRSLPTLQFGLRVRSIAIEMRPPDVLPEPPIEHPREPESDKATKSEQKMSFPVKPLPVQTLAPTPAGEVSADAKVVANESGDESDQVRREESMLLRNADDFMRKLFENRPPVQPASSDRDRER